MAKQGYIKLYRQIEDTSIWTDSDKLKLWLLCLMKATHEEQTQVVGNQTIPLNSGQFITGRNAISEDFNRGISKKKFVDGLTLFRWLELFEKLEMLNIKKTNKYSLVTIVNWDKYQTNEQQVNIKRTSDEHQMNTNKNEKNVKNVENEKKKTYSDLVAEYTDDEDLRKALLEFVNMRKAMKGFTLHALELKLFDLNKLAVDVSTKTEIVNQTIANSWKGFFALKTKKQEQEVLPF